MQDSLESAREDMWLSQAKFEANKHKSMRYQRGRGTYTLFILDFSESMRGEGVRRMKQGVSDILDEFSKHQELDENVAVIVFGEETSFLQYYSNNYRTINQSIEHLQPSGASPLTAAFLLALGGLYEGSAGTRVVGDFILPPRVVVFTDGRLTNFADDNAKEDDEANSLQSYQLLAPLFSITRRIGKTNPIFCFPVGDTPNSGLLHAISRESKGGQVLDISRARWFGRYTLHYYAADAIFKMTNQTNVDRGVLNSCVNSMMNGNIFEEGDVDTIRELLSNRTKIMVDQVKDDEDSEDEFYKEKYATAPKLGTRVRRGPHWIFENQDSESAGTIVGHRESAGLVNVEWDNGIRSNYSHGYGGIYNVVVCDEPRISENGFPAVGCYVKRGPDWKWEDQDGGVGSIGTVYRLKIDATVYVRWPSGKKGNYRFGYDGKFDVEVCDPFSPEVIKAVKDQQQGTQNSHSNIKSLNDIKENTHKKDTAECKMAPKDWKGSIQKSESTYCSTKVNTAHTLAPERIYENREISNDQKYTKPDIGAEDTLFLSDDNDKQTNPVCENPYEYSKRGTSDLETDTSSSDVCPNHEKLTVRDSNCPKESHVISLKRKCSTTDKKVDASDLNMMLTPQKGNVNSIPDSLVACGFDRRWQWLNSSGAWIDYPADVNNQINQGLQQRPNASVLVKYKEQSFRIAPSKSIQINIESKERQSIRWQNSK